MGLGDGAVVGTSLIVDHGSPADRWNLVIVGDGYRQAELAQFATNAQDVVTALFGAPPFSDPGGFLFPSLTSAINVYRVDVRSTDSGADDPAACGGTGATAATFFDSSFCNSGIRRLLLANSANVIATVNAQVPQWHAILVLVNSTVYGGGGGAIATASLAPGALEIALHELGHSAFGLADEYEYWAGCGVDTNRNNHPAGEPSEVNVTTTLTPLKWLSLVTSGTTIPTTSNPNCAVCDPQGNPVAATTVGAFEGAHYYHCDAWRPQFDCKMRALNHDWCAVCRQRIRTVLGPFRPRPRIWDILQRLEEVLIRRFPHDWVVDPAPFDLTRMAQIAQRMARAGRPMEDELSTVLVAIESMSEADVRHSLLHVRSQIARLEAAASTLEAALKSR
jgi:IgA Peptidase M64